MGSLTTITILLLIVIFHISVSLFQSTLLSFCKPQSKLDNSTLRHGSRESKNATEKIENMTLAWIRTQVLGLSRRSSTHRATM